MNKSSFSGMLLGIAMTLFFISCGGDADKTTTETSTDTTTTAVAPTEVVNTISTNPENVVLIRHKVGDFAKWMAAYEGHDSARRANGLRNWVIGRGVDDSSMVMVALKVDDIAKAKAFAKDPGLKTAMQKGGVTGTPRIDYTNSFWRDTLVIPNTIRAMTSFMVKDKDAWRKNFDEGQQERTDNGISTRVISSDADNPNKIYLVTALADTAKARAYWNSDALQKRRDAGGVIGKPERFVFTIVKRY